MYKIFVEPREELTHLTDVVVAWPRAIIVDAAGQLVLDQLDEVLVWFPDYFSHALKRGSTMDNELFSRTAALREIGNSLHRLRSHLRVLDDETNYIYMAHPFGFIAYGHLFDSLQRLRHALGRVPQPFKVLHFSDAKIVDFKEHMRRLGIGPDQLLRVSEPCVVPNLWVTPWQSHPAQLTEDAYDWIYERYTASAASTPRTRLYLSRNHVRPGTRSALNEAEVVEFLTERGFVVVRGDESLDEIIQLFHAAEAIVGAHGSLFANAIFCQDDCRIEEYCPANRPDYSFKRKRKRATHYNHRLVEADDQHNIVIPMESLREFVADIAGVSVAVESRAPTEARPQDGSAARRGVDNFEGLAGR